MARFKFVKKASSSMAYKPLAPNPAAKLAMPPEMGAAPSGGDSLEDEQVAQQIQSQEMVQIMLHVAVRLNLLYLLVVASDRSLNSMLVLQFGTLFYLRYVVCNPG